MEIPIIGKEIGYWRVEQTGGWVSMPQPLVTFVSPCSCRETIGKGVPPLELENDAQVVEFVRSNSGAIGYVDAATPIPGVKVLLSLP